MSRLCQNINCNNNISAQITCHLNRYRTGQSPINIFFITNTGRNKHARNRCRCAYCLSGISIVKYSTGTLFEFSGYCIKRYFHFFQRHVINLLINIVFNFLAIKKAFHIQGNIAYISGFHIKSNTPQLFCRFSTGIYRTYNTARTGSHNKIWTDSLLLQNLNYPYVRIAPGTAATQDQSHNWPLL